MKQRQGEYNSVRANYVRIDMPQVPATEMIVDIQNSDEIFSQVLENQALFYSMSDNESCALAEYCACESNRMGFDVSIAGYVFF